ncbi:hypothetical protein RDWZM_002937 [Blomia tropicalis]|uniref:MGAT4 conserved region domain-containing protein n=1 Tax=Blomia tropicalis TaxID=40697 RepID=A0A9Q0MEX6_BLOTA|nr:hypothetical protein RDWZM_002937 [Blomia tropicalis]
MIIRKHRLLQAIFSLILVGIGLPILFNVLINRTTYNQTTPYSSDQSRVPILLYAPPDVNKIDIEKYNHKTMSNWTELINARDNFIRSVGSSSLEDQIAYGFADLTNRLKFAEVGAIERRQEIHQLMKEIRNLWTLIKKRNDVYSDTITNQTNVKISNDTSETQEANYLTTSNEYLSLPSIFSLMSHVHLSINGSINPSFRIALNSNKVVRFVFGIPTVKRPVESYLIETLQNLIQNLSSEEQQQACFVVLIAETDMEFVQKTADEIVLKFPNQVKMGLIEIISPPAEYYPDMNKLKATLGDSMERVQWRSKQNLDYAYLMMYCQQKGIYYVQLEDDIITKPSYLVKMHSFAIKHTLNNADWVILDFCSLGFIGKMFKTTDLSKLILFFVMFYNDKPVDWLLDNFVDTKICSFDFDKRMCKKAKQKIWILHKPSLFQHIGTHSSLKGKIQKLRDIGFGKNLLHNRKSLDKILKKFKE